MIFNTFIVICSFGKRVFIEYSGRINNSYIRTIMGSSNTIGHICAYIIAINVIKRTIIYIKIICVFINNITFPIIFKYIFLFVYAINRVNTCINKFCNSRYSCYAIFLYIVVDIKLCYGKLLLFRKFYSYCIGFIHSQFSSIDVFI